MIFETLHDNWTAVISEDGRQISFRHNNELVVSVPALVWSLLRPLPSEATSGLRLRTPWSQFGEYIIAGDVVARTMTLSRDGQTLLTMTAAEVDSLYATSKAALIAYRQSRSLASRPEGPRS